MLPDWAGLKGRVQCQVEQQVEQYVVTIAHA